MPKSNVGKSVKVSPLEEKRRLLRSKLAGKGMNQGDLAKELGLSPNRLSERIRDMFFTTVELSTIVKVLDLDGEDLKKMVS